MKRFAALFAAIVMIAAPAIARPSEHVTVAQGTPPGSLELVGHDALMNRGMNAALAVTDGYAYVGSRTDGLHPNSGVMIVDVHDPSKPSVVGQITQTPTGANDGETSRELRIWPQQHLLIVLYLASNCSPEIHECSPTQATKSDTYRFYDISGDNAAAPKLVAEYVPTHSPHEFFLWSDPKNPKRALMYQSEPGSGTQLSVIDISGARDKKFKEIATYKALVPTAGDNRIHSMSISPDGKTGYIAALQGGFWEIDTSQVAAGKPKPKITEITPILNRAHWDGPGDHSSVPVPGSPYVLTTDEVYGKIPVLLSNHGCPWGWVRLLDLKDPTHPKVVSEYKLPENDPSYCSDTVGDNPVRNSLSSWSAHNPTLTNDLAFVTWHSGGLQAIDISDPTHVKQAAAYTPTPEPAVVTEDPALSSGEDKVVMWSYPIVVDGLIYVVDIRNGFYVLRYAGPHQGRILGSEFEEGNSNIGFIGRFRKRPLGRDDEPRREAGR
ncbi:MAG: LVIVD repeat-containing protein, partial [Actinomycetota bacterium]